MIDPEKLRKDLLKLGFMLAGRNVREPLDNQSLTTLELAPTSPIEARQALTDALNMQGNNIRDIGPCGRCDGQGVTYDLTRLPVKCATCKGTGRLTTTIPEHNPWID